jgi:hypothetical protein
MRRVLLAAVALTALTLTAPAAALAGHARHHHKRRAHHAQFRFMHLSAASSATTQTATPTTPSTPATPSTENAGVVSTYEGGVLKLTLNDGSTVSGKVTSGTRIECVSATPAVPTAGQDDEGSGDDNGEGDDQSQGDHNQQQVGGQQPSWHGQDGGEENGDDGVPATTEPPCDSSALLAKAIVREAELRIGPGGTEFESILLFR